jgi:hypothetical protein
MGEAEHRYEIQLKQGDLLIELSSDDDYFITKQLDKWYKAMLDPKYHFQLPPSRTVVRDPSPPPPQPTQSAPPAPVVAPPPPDTQLVEAPAPAPMAEPTPEPAPVPTPEPAVAEDASSAPQEALIQDASEDIDTIDSQDALMEAAFGAAEQQVSEVESLDLPAGATELVKEMLEPSTTDPITPVPTQLDPAVKDDFEAVMASIQEDLQKPEPVDTAAEPDLPRFAVATGPAEGTRKPDLEFVESLTDLYERSRASSPQDFLLLSAYYLTYCEKEERFSLKRLNSLIVKSGLTPVNHSVIESALEQGLLELVPDMTGTAEVTEYRLTDASDNSGKAYTEQLF